MKKNKSLTKHVVFILGTVIVIMFTAQNYLSIRNVQKSTAEDYKDSCAAIVRAYATNLQSRNSNYMQQIRIYTQDDNLKNGTHEHIVEWIRSREKARSKDFIYAAYVDADGMAFSDSGETKDVRNQYFCKWMLDEKQGQLYGNPIKNPFGTDWVVPLTKSYMKGSTNGFMTVGLPLSTLQEQIPNITLNGKGYAFILSGDGTVMAHPVENLIMNANFTDSDEHGYKGISVVAKQMLSGEPGDGWFTETDGTREFVSFAPIKGTSWSLGFAVTQACIYTTAGNLRRHILIQAIVIIVVLLITAGFLISRSLKPLKNVDKAIHEIASGKADLTQRIKVKTEDEIGSVTNGFNDFIEKLQTLVSDIKSSNNVLETAGDNLTNGTVEAASSITEIIANITSVTNQVANQSLSVEQTASAVEEIAQNINSLERMIENQSAGVIQASSAVEEMIGNIASVNASVEKMATSFHELEKNAITGSQKQEDVNARIEEIESQSDMLQNANTAIANIASQTNLLAMNAAIEAAHAGDAGKGFSVVADEIRKLSETSTTQSKTIGDQLNKIKESIGTVVSASSESSATFSKVADSIHATDTVVQQIKSAMEEQQEGSRQISEALHSMNDSTSEVRSASKEMATGNQAILKEVKNLQDVSLNIKNSMDEMSIGAGKINETSSSLSVVTNEMKDAINKIGSDINQFNT